MRVLIAVPCFNEELSIEECIENIRTATKNLNTDICILMMEVTTALLKF